MLQYDETDFVLYALDQMNIPIQMRNGRYITLANGYQIEVEGRNLYRLSIEGFVISPFDDIGVLCQFIQRNRENATD